MRRALLTFLILSCFAVGAISQESQEKNFTGRLSVGAQLGQYQKDFGFGMHITSPYFKDLVAVRARGNFMWNEYLRYTGDTGDTYIATQGSYSNVSMGLLAGRKVSDFARFYGEAGAIFLFPPCALSPDNYNAGFYGLLGFEFFISKRSGCFIDIGGVKGARATEVIYDPFYSNGLLVHAGYRFYL